MYQKLFKIGQKKEQQQTSNIQQHTTTNLHLNLKCKLTLFDQFGAHNFQYKIKILLQKLMQIYIM